MPADSVQHFSTCAETLGDRLLWEFQFIDIGRVFIL